MNLRGKPLPRCRVLAWVLRSAQHLGGLQPRVCIALHSVGEHIAIAGPPPLRPKCADMHECTFATAMRHDEPEALVVIPIAQTPLITHRSPP